MDFLCRECVAVSGTMDLLCRGEGGGGGEGGVCWSCKRYLVSKGRGDYDGRQWAQIPSMFNTYDRYPESTVSKCAMRPENLTI